MSILLAKTFAATNAVAPVQPAANPSNDTVVDGGRAARRPANRRTNPFLARPQAFALFHNWKAGEAA